MPATDNKIINLGFMQLIRRSERGDHDRLVDTFVNLGALFALLESADHQIIFGRRGTGKTHAFNYLLDEKSKAGDIVVYVDLSNIGSSGGIYSDQGLPITERATRLLVDTLAAIHERLYEFFIDHAEDLDLSRTGPLLDAFAEAITKVRVVGETETQQSESDKRTTGNSNGLDVSISKTGLTLKASASSTDSADRSHQNSIVRRGAERHTVHFGAVRTVWEQLVDIAVPRRTWILLDEWSSVPFELQPFLADLIRRSIFPVHGAVVKIAAIEQRSQFSIPGERGNYFGIEVGADAAADINLDDFMVFDNDATRSKYFYRSLLFKHISSTQSIREGGLLLNSEANFIRLAFTQTNAFDELVRASEGVPRDAINIVIQAATYAGDNPISMENVRRAARTWFQRDKEGALRAADTAAKLLNWITAEVIGTRRARAFLLRSDVKNGLIEALFDARVLHILKRSVSTHDEPGERYNVFKLDYGCYVDLMTTAKAPEGLLPGEDDEGNEQFVDVPPDDYRAIRRAILRLDDFYLQQGINPSGVVGT